MNSGTDAVRALLAAFPRLRPRLDLTVTWVWGPGAPQTGSYHARASLMYADGSNQQIKGEATSDDLDEAAAAAVLNLETELESRPWAIKQFR